MRTEAAHMALWAASSLDIKLSEEKDDDGNDEKRCYDENRAEGSPDAALPYQKERQAACTHSNKQAYAGPCNISQHCLH